LDGLESFDRDSRANLSYGSLASIAEIVIFDPFSEEREALVKHIIESLHKAIGTFL